MNRPSNKIIILIGAAILVVGGTFFFKNYGGKISLNLFKIKNANTTNQFDSVKQLAENEINKDSDNDGLKDWEEKLWKTDASNPDTDKDGTPDGQEVKDGRDPIVPNTAPTGATPNDAIRKETAIKNIFDNSAPNSSNSTENLSQEFFSEYLSAQQSGTQMSDADKETLIGNLLAKEVSSASVFKKYESSDLNILTDGSQSTIRSYGNAFGEIIITNATTDLENELSVLETAITNQDRTKLNDLDLIISRYKIVIEKSLKIGVPPTAVVLHLNFINAISGLADSITKMKSVIDDPLVSLKGLSIYSESDDALSKSIADFASYFKENGIVFNSNEYGYTFRTGI